ncbi:uncharacterized protein LOC144908394 [Branchiostoma floridae x Branchiostoma belcheri]
MGNNGSTPSTPAKLPVIDGTRFRKYDFPFENLVMEGGGVKGLAHLGAVKILDDAGILEKIKRFGGTSAGAVAGGLLVIGMTPKEILDKVNENLQDVAIDKPQQSWILKEILKLVPAKFAKDLDYIWYLKNLKEDFGMLPGDAFLDWYGKTIEEHLQTVKQEKEKKGENVDKLDRDINFEQVFEVFEKELCTVSYEPEFSSEVYSHLKTSPLLEIKKAVRMSMSIPVLFEAYKPSFWPIQARHVDGGFSANYPIYCFEGWWLSMDPANTFEKKLRGANQDNNFLPGVSRKHFDVDCNCNEQQKEEIRKKTIGLHLFSDVHYRIQGAYQDEFEKRTADYLKKHPEDEKYLQRPNTTLANAFDKKQCRQRGEQAQFAKECEEKSTLYRGKIKDVVNAFPDEEKMKSLFNQLTDDEVKIINNGDANVNKEAAFNRLFRDYKGELTTTVATNIFENQVPLDTAKNSCLKGNFADSSMELYDQFWHFLRPNIPMKEYDVGRSAGINVGYITGLEFGLEAGDKEFLMNQAAVAAVAFLEEWVSTHNPPLKEVPVQQTRN